MQLNEPIFIASRYLKMATEGRVVQRSPARSVRHIHIAEQRDEGFGAAYGLVCCGDVQRRLPVLVSGIYVGGVFQQHLDSLLEVVVTTVRFLAEIEITACDVRVIGNMQRRCVYLTAGGHSPVQRSEPLVIFGINSGTYRSEDTL